MGSARPIAEGLQRFDLAEYLRRPDAVKPNASCIGTISNGKISAQIRYTETSTCFGCRRPWMLCPRCSRRCRVLFLGFGRVACRRCFRLRYQSQALARVGRAQHAMGKIAAPAAENGATTKQLMAIFGWLTLEQAETYVWAAEKENLARDAVGLLVRRG
jgi:hypothetical protein